MAHSKAVQGHFRTNDETRGEGLFHSNRSCRLAPAHEGMKSWSCGLVRRIGTADSATPLASRSLRPHYIYSFRHRPSAHNSERSALGESA